MRVQVYWNYHKKKWSVVALEGEDKGRVITHADVVMVEDAKLAVQPRGNEKVREEGKKNVHAFVRGQWASQDEVIYPKWLTQDEVKRGIKYNPYKYESFVLADTDEPVYEARSVALLGPRNVFAKLN